MHLTNKELNALGQITQKGWGVSSMPNSIICSVLDDRIVMKFMTVVHFATEQSQHIQTERISYESIQLLTKCVADLKSQFKDMTGNSIKLKEIANNDSFEVIVANNLSPRRVAYYRRQVTLQVL
jgi:hypothetical protein